ncbi:diaminohydroxyphosphoribosylaminopyrimidine deaminase/5-amino-6-(5-phosphoribosylamino)uracil reductase [Clostridium tetanomorphum]|uniref:bifunctional diaminohydroxyphosphoribosylaminopyrimidine deaminase/5-amino-6-(5-phosphoribosylamino)uracil reductase RibD n=1 Tax=Clostridium tetanomorphum TaxID=1553 RepID=UPI000446FEDD|nr:bifunctional diaminohydroxyphosphoribosylaminopyrimidine deaminase/5-amino-6-(5-phosphoribosylamino)uracil reductase RibD [Clostridium tetanomorphum]KAJ51143.1 riboflavin biosynthesis protein RibD [Clostridium tetanomorphum DSM 665]MBP1864429.1 diaminohydroxyphosphoribosylaminopyrimidine deaminase/5-amino-6-(5-phosphoribosylamino)uracil reductase [Clostridium tetanomorphum]NRS83040.1 diaminohydroxyphosphoribosylaminopyrimidine deaminase/5-amino-6-(5-phosphoribosylamino)uracil reductase [Clost
MEERYMKRALELAKGGIGYVNPNPLVGAVILKDGKILGEGYHKIYGGAHAEINAFNSAQEDVKGASMYVTLEPCSHYGKTPPCAKAIVEKGIKKVIVAMLDPNPLVSGKGMEILRNNGIEVEVGLLEEEAKKLNEIFIKYITTKRPFCIMKTASTLDGKIATVNGDSKWITNEKSREYVHHIRHRVSAIMVGVDTVIKDNPSLTTRIKDLQGKNPVRVIVDSSARIPLDSKIFKEEGRIIIVTTEKANKDKIKEIQHIGGEIIVSPIKENKVDLNYLMLKLGEMKIDSVLLEGGSTLNYSALKEGIVDKVMSFIAPKIIGGIKAKTPVGGEGIEYIKDCINLKDINITRFDNDILIEGNLARSQMTDNRV